MKWSDTALTAKLGIRYPIILAPMAGGITTPALVAAISEAGGLGSLGAGYMEPEAIRSAIAEIRALTNKPFAVNLFIPNGVTEDAERIMYANQLLAPYRAELGLAESEPLINYTPSYTEQLGVLFEESVKIISFAFGIPALKEMELMKQQGIMLIGTATNLLEAILLEESGLDAIVAQSAEAGGQRATFAGNAEQSLVGAMALLPLLADHIKIPIIAAGGIMDGRGIAAALTLGADAAQLGTAFLACPESGAHPNYKERLLMGTEINTTLTRAFSGKLARELKNRFITELSEKEAFLPGYPIQHALTEEIRQTASEQKKIDFMSMCSGQGCSLCSDQPASLLFERWLSQIEQLISAR